MAYASRELGREASDLKALRREIADTMEPTRHIQRLLKPDDRSSRNPYLFGAGKPNGGFDDGAFGALPNSMGRIYDYSARGELASGSVGLRGGEVFYICRRDVVAEVARRIKKLGEGESWEQRGPKRLRVATADFVGLRRSLDHGSGDVRTPVGWLEIDNHFLFFTDREMFGKAAGLFGLKP